MVGSYLFYSCTSFGELVSQQIFKAQIEGFTYFFCVQYPDKDLEQILQKHF